MSETVFAGVKVLEYCEMVSGPYCTKLLADLGAEVIKIEKPETGDAARQRGPFPKDINNPERSGLFLYLNTNKFGVTLNTETTAGKKVFQELVKGIDILVEDTTPGTLEHLGLSYDVLRDINPSLIMTAITPYGQTGPYRGYKAHHLNIYHISGQAHFSYSKERLPEQAPTRGGGYVGDYDAGLSAAVATLAALYWRGLSGIGQYIDVSREEALISLDRIDIGAFANEGAAAIKQRRIGMLGGLMPCQDGYVVIVAPQQHQWQGLVKMMGSPEWALGEKCRDEFTRSENAEELQPLIEEWMLQHTRDEIYHGAQQYGCPVGPVNTAADVFASPQMRARGFFADIDHPEAGKLSYPSASYMFSETGWQASRAAPILGEHNRDVYCGRLNYTEEELADMEAQGTV